jgi:TolB protein
MKKLKFSKNTLFLIIVLLAILTIVVIPLIGWSFLQTNQNHPLATLLPSLESELESLNNDLPPMQESYMMAHFNQPLEADIKKAGIYILSMSDGKNYHLFAYHPQHLPLTRLTNGEWDDITPAISPDGAKIAFSSRKNGYWNIYILNLEDNSIDQITDTPDYDGAPSWSPDGQWLTFESYLNENLEIMIVALDSDNPTPIQLTDNPFADHSPAWSTKGREIAFVSNRTGQSEIWLAKLDDPNDRFVQISSAQYKHHSNPSWSPNGQLLSWETEINELRSIVTYDFSSPESKAEVIGSGGSPVWGPDGKSLLGLVETPNDINLIEYNSELKTLNYSLIKLPGYVEGLDWQSQKLPELLQNLPLNDSAYTPHEALFETQLDLSPSFSQNRFGITDINGIEAPYPYLHDLADESFLSLRDFIAHELGWDFLESLENAYTPITIPSENANAENWLMTGRAFSFNPAAYYAGWIVIHKTNFSGETYWQVFLKTRFQDGSQGRPLREPIWDINSRYTGDPIAYDNGGSETVIPTGYWVNFTEIAQRFGWDRLPALNNWQTFYPSMRFNQFVYREGLDYQSALDELYPPEAIRTSTPKPTMTPTPTKTPQYSKFITPSPSPSETLYPTIRPTWTPSSN